MTNEAEKPPWVDAVLAEYEAHRHEVLAEAQAQQQTLALGATAVGLVVAGGFNVWDNRTLASVAFLGVVPLLCLFVLVQWVGRAVGLLQVGVYLEQLEDALRVAFPSAPPRVLVWERTLAGASDRQEQRRRWEPRYVWQDYAAIAIFAVLAYGSIALGSYRIYSRHHITGIAAIVVEALLLSVLALRFLRGVATARRRLRQSLDTETSEAYADEQG
jgi:hypothetical protein